MASLYRPFWLLLFLLLSVAVRSQTLDSASRLQIEVTALDGRVARIAWNSMGTGANYTVSRRMPQSDAAAPIATTTDLQWVDTLRASICDDSVWYVVSTLMRDTLFRSNVAGVPMNDNMPTSPCSQPLVTVLEESQQLQLSWQPAPDDDIWGYYVCQGTPCLDFDTMVGRSNVVLNCASLSPLEEHAFRVYAVDSCYTASPLTEVCNNLVLHANLQDCTTEVTAWWNRCGYLPEGLDCYLLWVDYGGGYQTVATLAATDSCRVQFTAPSSATRLRMKVEARNATGSMRSQSNCVEFTFSTADTARFLSIEKVSSTDDGSLLLLSGVVDSAFQGNDYTLYRQVNGGAYVVRGVLSPNLHGQWSFRDDDVNALTNDYSYRVGVLDGCGRNEKFSAEANAVRLAMEGETAVQLSWTPYRPWEGHVEYEVLRRRGSEFDWLPIGSTSALAFDDALTDVTPLSEPLYYKVVASSTSGSWDTLQSAAVRYSRPSSVWIPNAFTPSESSNNLFCVSATFVLEEDYSLCIFNRQGTLLFESTSPDQCWDGSWDGKPLPAGAYTYLLFCSSPSGESHYYKGTVLLIR